MDELSLSVAVVLSVLASCAFAGAAVLQHEAIGHQSRRSEHDQVRRTRLLSLGFLRDLVRRPLWWIGFGLSGLGAVLNLTALSGAPVAVVQPITVLSVPLAVLASRWRAAHTKAGHARTASGPSLWIGVAAAMVGVTCFVALAARHTTSHPPSALPILVAGVAVAVAVVVLVLVGQRGPDWAHSLAWAGGAATAYGLAAAYMKTIFTQLEHGIGLSAPTVWAPGLVLLLAYPVAAYMLQNAFVSGAPEAVVGGLTVIDPIVAVVIGAWLLGEGSGLPALVVAAMLACAVVAVVGVVVLSRHHPDAQRARADHDVTDLRTDPRPGTERMTQ